MHIIIEIVVDVNDPDIGAGVVAGGAVGLGILLLLSVIVLLSFIAYTRRRESNKDDSKRLTDQSDENLDYSGETLTRLDM